MNNNELFVTFARFNNKIIHRHDVKDGYKLNYCK